MNNQLVNPNSLYLPTPETESAFSLTELKQTLSRQWKPALLVASTVCAGIFLSTVLQNPKYQSQTLILLENQKTQQSASVSPEQQSLATGYYNLKDLSTEVLVLRSYPLIAKAVKQVQQKYGDLTVTDVMENLSITQAAVNEMPTDVLVVSYTDTNPERAKAVLDALGSTYVEYSLNRQRSQAGNAINFIDEQLPKAQAELNEVAKAIRNFRQTYNIVDPDEYALRVIQFRDGLEQQEKQAEIALARTQRQYQEINRQLRDLGQNPETIVAYTLLSQDQVYQSLASQLKELETQYALGSVNFYDSYHVMEDIKLKQAELRTLMQERSQQILGDAVSQVNLEAIIVSQGSTSQVMGINGADTQAQALNPGQPVDSQGASTQVSGTISTIQSLASMRSQVETEQAALQSQIAGIQQAKTKVEKTFKQIPQLQQYYAEVKRQFDIKSKAVDYLMQRRQELYIEQAQENAPWQILEAPPLPSIPISPNLERGILLALVAGSLMGVATAFLLQKLDQRVKQVEEVKQMVRLPLLGTIPKVEKPLIQVNGETNTKAHYYNYSSFTEGLRTLAMNLRYTLTEKGKINSLALTSATSAEGKTTVTYNLGIVLAELGLNVLIIDADMRKPKIHKLAKLPNDEGLSEAITTERPWTDFVQIGVVENLHLITSGSTSPNPIALLNSDKMKQLLQQWQEAYDYVLVDTPPIGVVADAKSLANQVDSVLFVVGIEKATRRAINNSLEILRNSQCNIAGFTANLVDREFDYYSYSYYDSYYNQSTNGNGNGNGNGHHSEGRMQQLLQQFRRRE
ncbi:capsular exopolysaccharide family protein [Stanieria sp. NIES-3757]|nr:capsular exopolysaccharide family protein [Stanieria sp. NIES-3757]